METPPQPWDMRPLQNALKLLLDLNQDFSVSRLRTFLFIADRSRAQESAWPPDPLGGWVPQTEVQESLGLGYSTMSSHTLNLAARGRMRMGGKRTVPMDLIEVAKMDEHIGRNMVRPTPKGRALYVQLLEAIHGK